MVILWTFQTQDLSTLVHLRLVAGHKQAQILENICSLFCFKGPVLAIMLRAPLLLFWFSWEQGGRLLLETGLLVGRGKKSKFAVFSGTNSQKKGRFCGNFAGIFKANFTEKRSVKNGRSRESFPSKFRWKAIGFALI